MPTSVERSNGPQRASNERFADRFTAVYALGSKVRGSHGAWSDFDVLVVVRDRDPRTQTEVVGIIVDEGSEAGFSFAPVINGAGSFELEKRLRSPFSENIAREGVLL